MFYFFNFSVSQVRGRQLNENGITRSSAVGAMADRTDERYN